MCAPAVFEVDAVGQSGLEVIEIFVKCLAESDGEALLLDGGETYAEPVELWSSDSGAAVLDLL